MSRRGRGRPRRAFLRGVLAGAAGLCLDGRRTQRALLAAAGDAVSGSPAFLLSEHGCGRATAYAETNKIVTIGERTHVAWLDSAGGGFRVRVRTLDRRTGEWSAARDIGPAFDNHGGPALTADSRGYLHVVYYPHHHPLRYRRSSRTNDASAWEEETSFGSRCTYPTLVCGPDDTLYLTCRESDVDPWVVNLYVKPPGESWRRQKTLLRAEAKGYSHFQEALAWGPDHRTLHLTCRIHDGRNRRGHTVGYLRSADFGETWTVGDSARVELPATAKTVGAIGRKTGGEGTGFRCGSLAIDRRGVPHVLLSDYDRLPIPAWLAWLEGDVWRRRSLLEELPREWQGWGLTLPGGLTFDEKGHLHIVLTLIQPGGTADATVWGHPSSEIIAFRSGDGGKTFAARVLSQPDALRPHWLPNLERPTGHHRVEAPGLIYTDGPRGENNRQVLSNRVYWMQLASPGGGS